MKQQLEIINEQEVLGKDFKVYGTFDNPLFLAKDVAEWIEHSNARMMLQKVDEDEKTKELYPVNNPYGGYQGEEQWFLTEDGLYEVLMQSRKPIAKAFKKEVKKILKEIRKTGSYSIHKKVDSYMIEDPIERAKRWIEEEQQRRLLQQTNEQLLITTEKQAQEIKHKDEVIMGLTKDTPRPELRKRINQIIRYGAKSGYPRRYGIAYNEFDLTYKKNVTARLNHAIEKGVVKPSTNRMEYICEHMEMTWEFYQVVVRVFEGDLRQLSLDILECTSREN